MHYILAHTHHPLLVTLFSFFNSKTKIYNLLIRSSGLPRFSFVYRENTCSQLSCSFLFFFHFLLLLLPLLSLAITAVCYTTTTCCLFVGYLISLVLCLQNSLSARCLDEMLGAALTWWAKYYFSSPQK